MNKSWILGADKLLNGAHVANVRLRPFRLGFFVPPDDPKIVARVIDSCCLTWCGYCNVIIPYPSNGLTEDWKSILEVLDPDHLVDCVDISEVDKADFTERGQHVERWQDPMATFYVNGAIQYSALKAFGEFLKSPSPKHIVINPTLNEVDPLYLHVIARFGRLRESFMEQTLDLHNWVRSTNYAQFVPVKEADFTGYTQDILLGISPPSAHNSRGSGMVSYTKLVDLTRLGLKTRSPSYSHGGGTAGNPQFDEGYAERIIITGGAGNIFDFALYWNLRGERPWSWPFPLWVPLDILESDLGQKIVKIALGWQNHSHSIGKFGSKLFIISSSASQSEMETRLRAGFPEAIIKTNELHKFFTGGWKYYLVEEQREVHFNKGHARVPLPKPEVLEKFAPGDRIAYEVGIDGAHLPQSKSLTARFLPRITHRGALQWFSYVDYWPDLFDVQIPDGFSILSSMVEDHGYECVPSDKGRLALGQLALLGGVENVKVIASSKVYKVLKELSHSKGQADDGQRRAFVADRPTAQFSRFRDAWGRSAAKVLVPWLVEKRVLFRGTNLRCPFCQLERWYEVDRMGEMWRCDGCQTNSPIPLGLDVTQWKYRVNELYAVGHDQGTLTHLLAMFSMHPIFHFSEFSLLGYYPGILLKGKEGASVPVQNLEIDLVAIWDGKLILVECKDSGEDLTRDEVGKLVKVANHFGSSQLLFVTPTRFPQADELFPFAKEVCTADLDIVEGYDLFDNLIMAEQVSGEDKATRYLERLASRLR
ncbi:MAG: hypothetical protein HY664_02585 [Chloroflexi bacterium]|nr:hypothetical protein [Chloroflexota bacterium]